MLFGKIETKDLAKADLHLPADHAATKAVLAKARKTKTLIMAGCAKWGRPDWVGKIYPKGTKASQFLEAYARQFNCIEFNAIFYKLPTKEEVMGWKQKVGRDFKFFPKFTEAITHRKRLKNAQAEVDAFLEVCHEFGSNLGPVFLMPHPQMGPKHFDTIIAFIDSLPKDLDLFVELRHPEWYEQPHFDRMFNALQQRKRGMVITDAAGRRDCVHMRLTTPEVFVRFVGNSLHPSDYSRIDEWVERIALWMKAGLQKCYFFMHQHEELYSPELCRYLVEQLNKKCGTTLHVPEFVQAVTAGKTKTAEPRTATKPTVKRKTAAKTKSPVKKTATKKTAQKAAVKKTVSVKAQGVKVRKMAVVKNAKSKTKAVKKR